MSNKEWCEYLYQRCRGGCKKNIYVCRAYFPERQPYVTDDQLPTCMNKGEAEECPQRLAGRQYHRERVEENKSLHCPFASNTICGKPYEWWCKGGLVPFQLTLYDLDDRGLPRRDAGGGIVYTRSPEDLAETCFSGVKEIYESCPNYQDGLAVRAEWRRVKGIK